MRNIKRVIGSLAATTLILVPLACGDDDGDDGSGSDGTSTSSTSSSTTSATDADAGGADGSAFPSDEFCDAVADFGSAQDGAQRNQALGDMLDAAGDDVPQSVTDAIEDLDTGDLPAAAYEAAARVLSGVCD